MNVLIFPPLPDKVSLLAFLRKSLTGFKLPKFPKVSTRALFLRSFWMEAFKLVLGRSREPRESLKLFYFLGSPLKPSESFRLFYFWGVISLFTAVLSLPVGILLNLCFWPSERSRLVFPDTLLVSRIFFFVKVLPILFTEVLLVSRRFLFGIVPPSLLTDVLLVSRGFLLVIVP